MMQDEEYRLYLQAVRGQGRMYMQYMLPQLEIHNHAQLLRGPMATRSHRENEVPTAMTAPQTMQITFFASCNTGL
jgi:hypothetical protein